MLPMTTTTPNRFLRSHDDRVLAGVAGGLGRAFGVDAVIFRIALAALVLAGGFGLLVYVIALLVVPVDDGTGQPAARRDTWQRIAVFGAIGTGAVILGGIVFWGAAWATAAGGGVAVAVIVLALGAAAVIGALRGVPRARWLAVPAVLLAFPAAVVSAADVTLDGGVGERTYRPTGTDPLPGAYRLGLGELTVDLRDLDWSGGRRVALELDVGVGHAIVLVPESVCVGARTSVAAGTSDVLGRRTEGAEIDHDVRRTPPPGAPGLTLDVEMGLGAFEVRHELPYDGRPGSVDRGARAGGRSTRAADRACAGPR